MKLVHLLLLGAFTAEGVQCACNYKTADGRFSLCIGRGDCTNPKNFCEEGECNQSTKTCTPIACPYKEETRSWIEGSVIEYLTDITVQDCQTNCDNSEKCLAYDYYYGGKQECYTRSAKGPVVDNDSWTSFEKQDTCESPATTTHDATKCRQGGLHDGGCCAQTTMGYCADDYFITWRTDKCYDGEPPAYEYTCTKKPLVKYKSGAKCYSLIV